MVKLVIGTEIVQSPFLKWFKVVTQNSTFELFFFYKTASLIWFSLFLLLLSGFWLTSFEWMSLVSMLIFCVKTPRRRLTDIFLAGDNICGFPARDHVLIGCCTRAAHLPQDHGTRGQCLAHALEVYLEWSGIIDCELSCNCPALVEYLGHRPPTRNQQQK